MADLELLPHHPFDSVYKYRGSQKRKKSNLQIIMKM